MKNIYAVLLLIFMFGSYPMVSSAQNSTVIQNKSSEVIEGLNIFPNPVSNGKIYISTKHNLTKDIVIFDVLGKKILSQTIFGKELKIGDLSPGVYILKIREGKFSATRKLIVR